MKVVQQSITDVLWDLPTRRAGLCQFPHHLSLDPDANTKCAKLVEGNGHGYSVLALDAISPPTAAAIKMAIISGRPRPTGADPIDARSRNSSRSNPATGEGLESLGMQVPGVRIPL